MCERETRRAWIARRVVDPTAVAVTRDRLYGWLGAPEPYRREPDPHVSVFGVRLPADRAAAFGRAFAAFAESVGRWRGSVSGYHLHPSARNPMVVALDVPLAIDRVASPLADLLAVHDGRVERGPTPAHVTLLKGGVRGEELQWAQLDDRTRERLWAVLGGATGGPPGPDAPDPLEPPGSLVSPGFRIELGPPELAWN